MPKSLKLSGDLGTHDPVVVSADGMYYEFQTGRGIPTKTSADLLRWKNAGSVFAQNPAWIAQQVSGATDLWAPDVSHFNGKFHLYYSASTFGSNKSCIGHATRDSLTSGSWQDQGSVVCSNAGNAKDDWNALDPNAVVDEAGTPWLVFGSFWSGIKLVKLTAEGKRADNELTAVAGRNGGAIEAPFIVRRCGYYYLFVSFDKCCAGADSTYRVMVGRSRELKGPYVDRAGVAMRDGGGTQVVAGAGAWKGPGHNAVLHTDKGDYNIYHAYAASDGHSELRISELFWDAEAWPVSGGP
jgi:arabinan endo-1,5-alpha-L-arabinosidase